MARDEGPWGDVEVLREVYAEGKGLRKGDVSLPVAIPDVPGPEAAA